MSVEWWMRTLTDADGNEVGAMSFTATEPMQQGEETLADFIRWSPRARLRLAMS